MLGLRCRSGFSLVVCVDFSSCGFCCAAQAQGLQSQQLWLPGSGHRPRRLWLPGPGHRPRRLWLPGPGPAVSAAMAPRLRAQPLVVVGPRLRACSPRWLRLPGSGTAALGGCGSRLQRTGPGAVAHGLSCSAACGILPNQRSDLCLLC